MEAVFSSSCVFYNAHNVDFVTHLRSKNKRLEVAYMLAGFTSQIAQSTSSHSHRQWFQLHLQYGTPYAASLGSSASGSKARRSFPWKLVTKVQKQSNPPVPGLKLAITVHKSRAMSAYVPGVLKWLLSPAHPVAMLSLVLHPTNPLLKPPF